MTYNVFGGTLNPTQSVVVEWPWPDIQSCRWELRCAGDI